VLGLFWQFGPASAYDVRRIMLDSPSTQWSASTGAIYPLVRKLERTGLIRSKSERAGRRERKAYAVTPAGVRVLRAWVGPPVSREAVSVSYDPLRTRARFLGVLLAGQRRVWIDGAQAALDEVEARVRRWQGIYDARCGDDAVDEKRAGLRMLTRHAELDIAGRRRWLAELRDGVGDGPGENGQSGKARGKRKAGG
jgi:DNA-binding PadR family transcriptional regulator